MRGTSLVVLSSVLVLFASTGCVPDHLGDLSADAVGDLSYPLAGRAPADAELRAACGEPAASSDRSAAIDRLPYLQEVTPTSALVMWTERDVVEAVVRVEAPDGMLVAERPGKADPEGEGTDGALARWARIDGLAPATPYCARLIDATGASLTERRGFRTAPEPGTGAPVRFLAFGDSGDGGADQLALVEQMRTVPFDLVVHTGDVAYDSGTLGQLEDRFFGVYEDLLGSFAVFPASGNHDYRTNGAAPFRAVFPAARRADWRSFDWGDVHFVVLDTEKIGRDQAEWLDRDLAASSRPWTVAVGHRPPFSSGRHGSSDAFREWFLPILERHRVHLVLSGHDHDYERTTPQNRVTYVVTGGGGRDTYEIDGWSSFTAFAVDVIHVVVVEVEADTLTLHAIDATGREFDSARIRRRQGS